MFIAIAMIPVSLLRTAITVEITLIIRQWIWDGVFRYLQKVNNNFIISEHGISDTQDTKIYHYK